MASVLDSLGQGYVVSTCCASEANSASGVELLSLGSCIKNMPSQSNTLLLTGRIIHILGPPAGDEKSNSHAKHSIDLEIQMDGDSRNRGHSPPCCREARARLLSTSKPPSDMGNSDSSCIDGSVGTVHQGHQVY